MPTPHCKHCGYPLTALPESRCPECGNAFDLRDLSTFENRYPRDWHDRMVDALMIAGVVVILLCVLAGAGYIGWYGLDPHPSR